VRVVDLPPSPARQIRDIPTRQAHRAAQFAAYFAAAHPLTLDWKRLAILPPGRFIPNRLVALENAQGFTLDLGIIRAVEVKAGTLMLDTPLKSLDGVDMLRLGDMVLDPQTFREQRLGNDHRG